MNCVYVRICVYMSVYADPLGGLFRLNNNLLYFYLLYSIYNVGKFIRNVYVGHTEIVVNVNWTYAFTVNLKLPYYILNKH